MAILQLHPWASNNVAVNHWLFFEQICIGVEIILADLVVGKHFFFKVNKRYTGYILASHCSGVLGSIFLIHTVKSK